jgi:hypothetical protein
MAEGQERGSAVHEHDTHEHPVHEHAVHEHEESFQWRASPE